MRHRIMTLGTLGVTLCILTSTPRATAQRVLESVFSESEWREVDETIQRRVKWLVSTQEDDGALPSADIGQPGVTSLGALAILSQGHLPGEGEYGKHLSSAIDFVLSCQKQNGLLAVVGPSGPIVPANVSHRTGQTAVYNHAISGLMLSEAYSTTSADRAKKMQVAIERALLLTLSEQKRKKRRAVDRGGWRYLDQYGRDDSDLSTIGWQLKFLRSAKNAGFDVPEQAINDAVGCVRNQFSSEKKQFLYTISNKQRTRAMQGAGILALAHSGLHETPEAVAASKVMLNYEFTNYNVALVDGLDRYHYSAFMCTQAAYQLGDQYWNKFHPTVFRTLASNQQANGSWPVERTSHGDHIFGSTYTTAMAVLTLSAPNQLLPIYQR